MNAFLSFSLSRHACLSLVAALLASPAFAEIRPVAGGEYFFGNDPGLGAGMSLAAPAAVTIPTTISLPASATAGLSPGVHTVSVRWRDAVGQWGAPATAFFVKEVTPSATLARLEWEWWKGNDFSQRQAGAPVVVEEAASSADLALRLPGGNLTPGERITVRAWWVAADGAAGAPAIFAWTVPAHQAAWVEHHFTAAEAVNPAISGPEADPDHDGVPNLLEQALGGDPRHAEPETAPTFTQDPELPAEVAFGFQRLSGGTTQPDGTYRQGPYAYTLEELVTPATGDSFWRPLPPDAVTLESTGPATTGGFEAVSARLPVAATAPTRLIRLKVTHTAP